MTSIFFLDSDPSTSTNSHDNTYTLDDANDTLNDMLGQHPGSKNANTNLGIDEEKQFFFVSTWDILTSVSYISHKIDDVI